MSLGLNPGRKEEEMFLKESVFERKFFERKLRYQEEVRGGGIGGMNCCVSVGMNPGIFDKIGLVSSAFNSRFSSFLFSSFN